MDAIRSDERPAESKPTSETLPAGRKPYRTPRLLTHGALQDDTESAVASGLPKSDRHLKERFAPVDAGAILARVARLPIETWNYKSQDAAIRHIGPMAQDFAAAFGVGEDDRHIHPIDASGVALAAIQALHHLVERQQEQVAALTRTVAGLEAENRALWEAVRDRRSEARAAALR